MTYYNDYLEQIKTFSAMNEEPAWMLALREAALAKIDELDLPFIERFRYHRWPLLEISRGMNVLEWTEGELDGNVPSFDEMPENPILVQDNELTTFQQLPMSLVAQGVIFTDLFSAMRDYPDLVESYYMTKAVPFDEDKLTAAHAAFMNSGAFLYVPKHVVIEEPIEAIFNHTQGFGQHFFKHILIVAEENSELTYMERIVTEGETQQISANIVVEVIAKAGARIKFSAVDRLGKNVTTYLNRRGYLMKDASIDWAIGELNDGDVIADFDSDLVGTGSHAELKAVAISSGRQTQVIDSRVTNQADHSIGHILQHGVILDKARLTFNGIGHIIKGAKGADAQQESRVLMLSDGARGDANPILLIDENEVTAGHAASVGRVDPEEMYYLMSRGLPKAEAERLVIRGFLGAVLTEIPVKAAQEEFIQVIEGKLGR